MRHLPSVGARKARERKKEGVALGLSLLIHLLVLASWKGGMPSPLLPAGAGPRAAEPRVAPGGGMQALRLAPPAEVIIVPPQVPLITLEVVEPLDIPPAPPVDFSALPGNVMGVGEGPPGLTGRGRGSGGVEGEGLLRLVPPVPKGMIIPPTNPRLRGQEVEVWVFVDAMGKVVPDSTRLKPPTTDRGFNQRLIREAAEWVFHPAQMGGRPVAAWFPYRISM